MTKKINTSVIKLSFVAPMVLPLGGIVGRRQLNIISRITLICNAAFLCLSVKVDSNSV